ncbi:dTDP-4-amino-4,6-dideoxygalactose transaminase [soil metagenome]
MEYKIPFNKPFMTGNEVGYIQDAVKTGKISGNGKYTKLCQSYFEQRYGFKKCLLTTSCTDALEMVSLLLDLKPGDEVIVPSYTFVSTANPFILRGAKIVFADSMEMHPNIDAEKIENLITPNTKVIVVVHYAGIACDMDKVMAIAKKYDLFVVEDAAQAINSFYTGGDGIKKPLGSIGELAAFSFHETKNIISGEGGMIVINDVQFISRAEIIWEKGTNRSAFFKGEIDKYGWVDIGSSFLPSEIVAAFLYAQLEQLDDIQAKRISIWNLYKDQLLELEDRDLVTLPKLPFYATNNAHIFSLLFKSKVERDCCIAHLKEEGILAVFHYLSLHKSPYFIDKHDGRELFQSDAFSENLLRLPLYYELSHSDVIKICQAIKSIFR